MQKPPTIALLAALLAAMLATGCKDGTSTVTSTSTTASAPSTFPSHAQTMSTSADNRPSEIPAHDQAGRERLKQELSPLQFEVVCNEATEPPFRNAYWDNKQPGIYVDIVSGEPLFSSLDKFDSGSGWPSFTRPLQAKEVLERTDTSHGMVRTEVRSRSGKAHLGHLFPDGPGPSGMRYCINSASLRFVPVADLEKEGYGEYLKLFSPR